MHFQAGVVQGEGEWSRCPNPHKVRRKSEVFCGEGGGLHRPVACKESGDREADEKDLTVHRNGAMLCLDQRGDQPSDPHGAAPMWFDDLVARGR
jgi:hypothetical protein